MHRRLAAAPLLAALLFALACADDDEDRGASPPASTSTTTTARAAQIDARVDWTARTITIDGEVPFDVAFCEGDAPLLCVSDGGDALGVIELASFPEGAVADFGTWAADFYESMRADRVEHGDRRYTLDGDEPDAVPVAGFEGVRYGFTGSIDGRLVERVVGYAFNDGAQLRLIVANGLADDGPLAREMELPVEVIQEIEPLLAAIARGSVV